IARQPALLLRNARRLQIPLDVEAQHPLAIGWPHRAAVRRHLPQQLLLKHAVSRAGLARLNVRADEFGLNARHAVEALARGALARQEIQDAAAGVALPKAPG